MPDITIAIDGYSSTGKSTVARQLAAALAYVYVDTGAMYRAVTLYALRSGLISGDTVDREALGADGVVRRRGEHAVEVPLGRPSDGLRTSGHGQTCT